MTTMQYNNSTGNDSNSGTSPDSAITGSDASTSSDGLTVTLPSADLSDVSLGDVIKLGTSSGLMFGVITGIADSGETNASVTVSRAFTGSLSGQNYVIGGGARLNPFSGDDLKLFKNGSGDGDLTSDMVIKIEQTGSSYDIQATVEVKLASGVDLDITSDSTTKPIINPDVAGGLGFNHVFDIESTSDVRVSGVEIAPQGGLNHKSIFFVDADDVCIKLDGVKIDLTNTPDNSDASIFVIDSQSSCSFRISNYEVTGVLTILDDQGTSDGSILLQNGTLKGCINGIQSFSSGRQFDTAISNTSAIESKIDLRLDALSGNTFTLANSITSRAIDSGLNVQGSNLDEKVSIYGNIFCLSQRYGIESDDVTLLGDFIDYNVFAANTLGARLRVSSGKYDKVLDGDPFTDSVNDDYTYNSTRGRGLTLTNSEFPNSLVESTRVIGVREKATENISGFLNAAAIGGEIYK